MKANSIEEDIKILEEMIENANIENMDMNNCFGGEHIEAIEHILSDYKRVLKENEELLEVKVSTSAHNRILELEKENEELKFKERSRIIGKYEEFEIHDVINRTLSNDYIPIQKIKDKIEELDIAILECEYSDDDDELYKKAVKEDKVCLLNQKRVLKELLKEEK